MYKLTLTDGREILLRQEPTFEQMGRYIRAMKARGYKLSQIMFTWGPVYVVNNVESIVRSEELKVKENAINTK